VSDHLPSGWTKATLGDLADYINGAAFKPEDWGADGTPIIRIQNLTNPTKPLNRTRRNLDQRLLIRRGDLLFSWSATLDAFIWDREVGWLNQHIFKVVPHSNLVDPTYLYYLLRSEVKTLIASEHLHGSTMRHINRGPFLAHQIGLPPLPEQRRIVARIEALFARTRRTRADLERIAPLTERYRYRRVDAELEAGRDEGWPDIALADVASETRNGIAAKPSDEPPGTPILRISAVRPGRVTLADRRYHRPATPGEDRAYHLRERDLLFIRFNGNAALVAACGMVRHLEEPCVYPDKLIRMRLDEAKALPEYVEMAAASSIAREQLADHIKTAAGQHGISGSDLKTLRLPMPHVAEQRSIAARVASHRLAVEAAEREATRALALLDRLEQGILTRAFRGELVEQDPNAESAEALLSRSQSAATSTGRRGRSRSTEAA
jgi:type I restriction enzyme S subunit